MIYICIPVYERVEFTMNCINSIHNQIFTDYRIIICEHSANDENYILLKDKFPNLTILRGDHNMWWTSAINMCVKYVLRIANQQDFIYTLNNDTILDINCLNNLHEFANPNLIQGCVNLLLDQRDRIEPSAFVFKKYFGLNLLRPIDKWMEYLNGKEGFKKVDTLAGKGVLIPIGIFKKIGLYEEKLLPHYHADTEFTFRAKRAGYSIKLNYSAKVYSLHEETGLIGRNSNATIKSFIKGFYTIKSTRHFLSLKYLNYSIYGIWYPIYLTINIIGITCGFLKRKLINSRF